MHCFTFIFYFIDGNRRSTLSNSKTQVLQSSRFNESFFSSPFFRKLTDFDHLLNGCLWQKEKSQWPRLLQDVFRTSLKDPDVMWPNQTSSRRLEKTSGFRLLEGVQLMLSWRRPIYDVSKTSDLRRLEDVWFMTSWWRPIYVFLETSSRRLIYNVLRTSDLRRLKDVQFTTSKEMIFSYFILSAIFRKFKCSCWG